MTTKISPLARIVAIQNQLATLAIDLEPFEEVHKVVGSLEEKLERAYQVIDLMATRLAEGPSSHPVQAGDQVVVQYGGRVHRGQVNNVFNDEDTGQTALVWLYSWRQEIYVEAASLVRIGRLPQDLEVEEEIPPEPPMVIYGGEK